MKVHVKAYDRNFPKGSKKINVIVKIKKEYSRAEIDDQYQLLSDKERKARTGAWLSPTGQYMEKTRNNKKYPYMKYKDGRTIPYKLTGNKVVKKTQWELDHPKQIKKRWG